MIYRILVRYYDVYIRVSKNRLALKRGYRTHFDIYVYVDRYIRLLGRWV